MNPDFHQIICEYLNFMSTSEIAEKYNLSPSDVKLILRNALPRKVYLEIAHTIGARKVHDKLKNPAFRAKYSRKMRKSVSLAICHRMKNEKFRKRWKKKARAGSAKGNERIRELLRDPEFFVSWSKRCSVAAGILRSAKRGIFNPDSRNVRRKWAILGLQRTGRKIKGPAGESMYNYLEVKVARLLLKSGLTYEYEKPVSTDNLNGFYSPDFIVEGIPVIIEVTYWDKIEQKCKELERKFACFKDKFPAHSLVVVTKCSLRDKYKRLLPDSINVLTLPELDQSIGINIQAKRGNKF